MPGMSAFIQNAFFFVIDLFVFTKTFPNRKKSETQRVFHLFVLATTAEQGLSMVIRLVKNTSTIGIVPQYVLFIAMFVFMALPACFCLQYLIVLSDKHRNLSLKERLLSMIPAGLLAAAALVSPWTHWVFYIDESYIYHRGPLFSLQLICPYSYLVIAFVIILYLKAEGTSVDQMLRILRNYICFVLPTIAGAATTLLIDDLGVGHSQIGISVGMLFLFLELYMEEVKENEHFRSMALMNEERTRQFERISLLNEAIEQRMNIIMAMTRVYFTSFYVNLEDDTFEEIQNTDFVKKYVGGRGKAQESLYILCDKMVSEDSKEELRRFVDFTTLDHRMEGKQYITCEYQGNVAGWCQIYIIEGNRNESGKLKTVFVATRTIHDEKEREESQTRELEEARVVAEAANAAKSEFLFNMSHDIRTPMNAILGFSKLMEKETENPEVVRKYLRKIEDSGVYLLSIINNVLDMARIESGKIEIEEVAFDIESEMSNIGDMFVADIEKKRISFRNIRNITHHNIYSDRGRLAQIFINLMSNAVKYTPEGGSIRMECNEIPCEREGYATYVTTVADTGIGMSEEFKEHIFESFTREKTTTESKVIGTGLGMAIVRNLVELLGGTIEVDSAPGEGTTFRLMLTHRIADEENVREQLKKTSTIRDDIYDFSGKHILIVEDNELNAEIAIALLEEMGIATDHASDGVECIAMLNAAESDAYDMILMDIQMPRMNGYETTEKIRNMEDDVKANIPIIAMTANAFQQDRKNTMKTGMNGYLAKPIDIPKMKEVISTVLLKVEVE